MRWGVSGSRAWGWLALGLVLSYGGNQGDLYGSKKMLWRGFDIEIGKEDEYIDFGRATEVARMVVALQNPRCCYRERCILGDRMELLTPNRRVADNVGIFF